MKILASWSKGRQLIRNAHNKDINLTLSPLSTKAERMIEDQSDTSAMTRAVLTKRKDWREKKESYSGVCKSPSHPPILSPPFLAQFPLHRALSPSHIL